MADCEPKGRILLALEYEPGLERDFRKFCAETDKSFTQALKYCFYKATGASPKPKKKTKKKPRKKSERRLAIEAALKAGEDVKNIAEQQGCTLVPVYKVRKELIEQGVLEDPKSKL